MSGRRHWHVWWGSGSANLTNHWYDFRREHWQLLGNLKTTVEGLVSANCPNVWSKYGGLERLCRDMQNILYHGLIHDQVCRINFPPNWLNLLENSCMKVVGREKVKPTGLCEILSIELTTCVCMLVYMCICLSAPPPPPSLSLSAAIDTRGMNKPPGQAAQQQEVRSVWFLLIP